MPVKNNFIRGKSKYNSPLERGLRGVSCKRHKSTSAAWTVIAVLFAVIFQFLSCCEDCPTCPEPERSEPGNYRLYAFDSWDGFLMSVDIPADTVIDSIRVDYAGEDIFVTPDGERLLVMALGYGGTSDRIEIFSTADLSFISTLDQYGYYYFDGGDNYGIWNSYKMIYFVDPVSLAPVDSIDIIDSDRRQGNYGYLDTVTNQFFVSSGYYDPDSTQVLYQIDCILRQLIDTIIVPVSWGGLTSIAHNYLTDDLYFLAFGSSIISFFHQYSLSGDSIINTFPISHVTGSIAVVPDGKRVIMTDGGHQMFSIFPEHPIWIIDAFTHQPISWVPPFDSSGLISEFYGQIMITPDGLRAYIGESTVGGDALTVLDLEQNRIIKAISPYPAFGASSIAIGPIGYN